MTPGAGIFRTKLPKGFTAGGVNCGVRRYRPDLGVIISEEPCIAVGVFTLNTCKAAPIKYCEEILPATDIKAVITNSGQANAATGSEGIHNNQKMVDALAQVLSCESHQILSASTGVIGEQLAIEKITTAIPGLVASVSNISEKFALAILTTDLVPKTIHKEVELTHGTICITGICKGSGMIHPNMGTMLGYLLTDAQLTLPQSQKILKEVCDKSFNMVSVDGETSTNDCVFMLANGMSGVAVQQGRDLAIFTEAMEEVAIALAKSIARDGEGASKLIQVTVSGMADVSQARVIARSLTVSPLIKTAIYGESPNWGRVLARLGVSAITEQLLNQCEIAIQGVKLFSQGNPIKLDMDILRQKMKEDTIEIAVTFTSGDCSAIAWGCDMSEKYVKVNAEYVS